MIKAGCHIQDMTGRRETQKIRKYVLFKDEVLKWDLRFLILTFPQGASILTAIKLQWRLGNVA